MNSEGIEKLSAKRKGGEGEGGEGKEERKGERKGEGGEKGGEKGGRYLSIDIQRMEMNETIARAGGSGASVTSCTIDGWTCAVKELELSGVGPRLVEQFLKEGFFF